ncbi:selenocysteine-specific translation elongation factor [Gudongella sp. DL1XJH-153]|uniref:selenocysteine-specific translation elongation factor n=1 Tax=Gudongella sp. DL1XJH-153 TaxID=3409804 RepID=UPI003BB4F27F
MKHLIIGTAGHIDHGKTTLIKALTGRETDRLKEEKDRGISIELGFTYFDLPNGQRAGIIDVPGHEKFIRNMLAGVVGIDIVMLVVAADEGIMPQTAEHLAILDMAGVKKGFVVITKADMVEEEWIELVKEEVQEAVAGTFLEGSEIIPVSSTKMTGIDDAIKVIQDMSGELEDRNINDMPRLPIDRVFTISGFGTVVTGTLLAGKFSVGDEVELYPTRIKSRIRSIQVHDQDAKEAFGGQRVAINLAGVKKDEIERGNIVAPLNAMTNTMMIDVKVKLLKSLDRGIDNRTRLKLYLGTEEILCRIVLLDKEVLEPGDEAYAQLRLESETVAKRGDRFILRFYSPMFTIGGGEILEPNPEKRKRFDDEDIEELRIKDEGNFGDIVEHIILDKAKLYLSVKELARDTSMLEESIIDEIRNLKEQGRISIYELSKDIYPIHINHIKYLVESMDKVLKVFHSKYPLRTGASKEEMRSRFLQKAKPKLAESIIDDLIDRGHFKQDKNLISLQDFKPVYTKEQLKIKEEILGIFKKEAYMPPKKEDLLKSDLGKSEEIEEIIMDMLGRQEILKLNDELFLLPEDLDKARIELVNFIEKNGGISVAEYRDLLNTNRKNAIGMLEYFDQIKVTKRDGEKRILVN